MEERTNRCDEPFDPVRRASGFRFRPNTEGIAGEVRIVRRPGPGVWTKYRIVVDGTKARLYVHEAAQLPDRQRPETRRSEGAVALW